MAYQERFSDSDLEQIIEEGLIYMCACPAQVADTLRKTRALYRYQTNCLESQSSDVLVHGAIAETAIATHSMLEDCLEKVLEIEKWDRSTLRMPPELRKRQAEEMNSDPRK